MRLAAAARPAELAALEALPEAAGAVDLRPTEVGLVMLRGRIGGGGDAFNLGEATVTRAAVTLGGGETGFGYVLGRDRRKARLAATLDALMQTDRRGRIEAEILAPIAGRLAAEAATRRARTAATRVDFFTVARGED
jgi:alpha-D-ribose 1-methylphosphonate 5-triphosphate synthase subunit PhnG